MLGNNALPTTTSPGWQTGPDNQYGSQTETSDQCLRKHPRFPTNIRALLYCRHRFQTTVISDLSQGGARLTGALGIMPHDNVTIQLLNGREIKGTVLWWLNGHAGLAFKTPLAENDPLLLKAGLNRHPHSMPLPLAQANAA